MRRRTVTLPTGLVEAIEARVAGGEYSSKSDVVQDGLEHFLADDSTLESWLKDVIVPRCRNRAAHPSTLIEAEEILDRVKRRSAAKRE